MRLFIRWPATGLVFVDEVDEPIEMSVEEQMLSDDVDDVASGGGGGRRQQ